MKLRSTGSLILAALLGCSGSSSDDGPGTTTYVLPRWANQQRVPTASHLRAVRFNTHLQGFIAGESTAIFATDDGGDTWLQEEHEPFNRGGDIAGLDFLGSELAAAGVDPSNGLGRRWASPDALHWTTADAPGALAKYVGVDMTPSITGGRPFITWSLRENWNINVSSSGSTPAEQTTLSALTPGGTATAIDLLPSGSGFIVGTGGRMYETTDWTGTWSPVTGTGANTLRDVQTTEAGVVFACGDAGTLVWTESGTAGGVAQLPNGPGAGTFRGLHFFHGFQDKSIGWLVGDGGVMYRVVGTYNAMTSTWGWTWSLLVTGTVQDLYDVHAVPITGTTPQEYAVYAVGDNGTVLRLIEDASPTVELLTKGATDTINAVSFDPSGRRGVAVGDNGKVFKTLDGGVNWTFTTEGGATKWTGASIPPGNWNTAYICGEGGQVRRNLDLFGGNAWTAPSIAPPNVNYRAILFPSSADVGIVAGDGSTLLYTNNGTGLFTWAAPFSNTASATDYKALSTSVSGGGSGLYAAGSNGVIAESTMLNYPTSWTPVTAGGFFAGNPIQAIQTPTSSILFAGVYDGLGTRLHRLLLGITWQPCTQPATLPPTATGLAFPTQSFGWWVSDGIYATENGGGAPDDWTTQPTHTKGVSFNAVWMNRTGKIGYVVGTDGIILKTVTGGK